MANFEPCFLMVKDELEGGDRLIDVPGDRGGQTYAGISRTKNRTWPGWNKIDLREFDDDLKDMVETFYREEFWNKIHGDIIGFQSVAFCLYDYAVNAGVSASVKICQKIIGVESDGVFGQETLKALNSFIADEKDEKIFIALFGLQKVFKYCDMVMNDPRRDNDLLVSNQKFLCGWINRVRKGLKYCGFS